MALKFKYPSQADVPEEHRGLYVERDGAFVLDAEGAVDKGRVDEFRTNNVALKRQLDSLTAKYEGIDPDAVKRLLAEKARLEEEKLLQDGVVEKLVAKRTQTALAEVEKRLHSAEPLAHAFVSHLSVTLENSVALVALVRELRARAGALGLAFLTLGFDARDPRLATVRRYFRGHEYRSRLYAVGWNDLPALCLDDGLCAPEVALL